jgi:hypothetical protein
VTRPYVVVIPTWQAEELAEDPPAALALWRRRVRVDGFTPAADPGIVTQVLKDQFDPARMPVLHIRGDVLD